MAEITRRAFTQEKLVTLLEKTVGRAWIPVSLFNDIGNAELGAIGSSTPVGMLFDPSTDEHIDTAWLVPKDYDVTKAASIYVYWSSADTNGTDCTWDIDYRATAAGDDIGVAVTNMTGGVDTDSSTADDLNIGPAISLPANTFGAVGEVLFMSLFRDVDASDDLATDATFYGIRIDYETSPSISTTARAEVTPLGMDQGNVVKLLESQVGQIWVPVSGLNDIGNATLVATGSSTPVGLTFDASTDEHADVTLKVPKDMDVGKAMNVYVYWSSVNTTAAKGVVWDADYTARALAEDIGVTVTNVSAGADIDSTTADDLNISPAIIIPAATFASTAELLFLSIFRDAGESADNVTDVASLYGIRIDYTTTPSISLTVPADITPIGMPQGDMVTLLSKSMGEIWYPIGSFSDIGAGTLAATGGVRAVGMTFDTSADEAVEINLVLPKIVDITQAMTLTVYWSSADTGAAETLQLDVDYIASAAADDVGDTVSNVTAALDVNLAGVDVLQTAEVITIPADALASNTEMLCVSLRRDVSADDLTSDASVYGVLLNYSVTPSISATL
ncbi:hypothetical protein LCGC14_0904030 [marine sediment metagenome]|uniref:Uncharacterized protein n=1 Tax=marine sediment metagenome TaxID=412755 RepID=A0A0F9REM0_9ZZZZ